MIRSTVITLSLASAALFAHAAPVAPSFTTFGDLAGATFGGSGIPTDPTAISSGSGVTIGLTAFGRYANPAIGNDGAGTYYATAGVNDGLEPGTPHSLGATWSFGYYINVGTAQLKDYQIDLFYDLDPAAGNALTDMGRIDLDNALVGGGLGGAAVFQDAQNLNFAFLSTGVPGVVFAPGSGPFNPNISGEYALVLRVRDQAGNDIATSSILVNAVPEPGSLALAGVALLGLVGSARRRKA